MFSGEAKYESVSDTSEPGVFCVQVKLYDGKPVGVLKIIGWHDDMTSVDESFVESIAMHIGTLQDEKSKKDQHHIVQKLQLELEEARKAVRESQESSDAAVDRQAALRQMSMKLTKAMTVNELFSRIVAAATQLVHADRGSLFLIDHKERMLRTQVAQSSKLIKIPFGNGIVGQVARTGIISRCADAYQDPRFDRSHDASSGYRTKSLLTIPIAGCDDPAPIAVLQLLNKTIDGQVLVFTQEDEDVIQQLLERTVAVIHGALDKERAIGEIQQANLALSNVEQDLHDARSVENQDLFAAHQQISRLESEKAELRDRLDLISAQHTGMENMESESTKRIMDLENRMKRLQNEMEARAASYEDSLNIAEQRSAEYRAQIERLRGELELRAKMQPTDIALTPVISSAHSFKVREEEEILSLDVTSPRKTAPKRKKKRLKAKSKTKIGGKKDGLLLRFGPRVGRRRRSTVFQTVFGASRKSSKKSVSTGKKKRVKPHSRRTKPMATLQASPGSPVTIEIDPTIFSPASTRAQARKTKAKKKSKKAVSSRLQYWKPPSTSI